MKYSCPISASSVLSGRESGLRVEQGALKARNVCEDGNVVEQDTQQKHEIVGHCCGEGLA